MTIWIPGGTGNLGACLAERLRSLRGPGHTPLDVVATGRADVDVTDGAAVERFARDGRFTHVFNCTAYTAVDRAESEPEAAAALNTSAVEHLARAARREGAALFHVSTDYVFDGAADRPYEVDAPCRPLGVYGRTKLEGEERLREVLGRAGSLGTIVRTSWLFGPRGRDFVGTMRKLLASRPELRVVDDQRGRPTYAPDLAFALVRLAGLAGGPAAPAGTYHFANAGETTWFALTCAIAELVGSSCPVHPITTAEYPTPASRPAYSVLSTAAYERATGEPPRPWPEALAECITGSMRSTRGTTA